MIIISTISIASITTADRSGDDRSLENKSFKNSSQNLYASTTRKKSHKVRIVYERGSDDSSSDLVQVSDHLNGETEKNMRSERAKQKNNKRNSDTRSIFDDDIQKDIRKEPKYKTNLKIIGSPLNISFIIKQPETTSTTEQTPVRKQLRKNYRKRIKNKNNQRKSAIRARAHISSAIKPPEDKPKQYVEKEMESEENENTEETNTDVRRHFVRQLPNTKQHDSVSKPMEQNINIKRHQFSEEIDLTTETVVPIIYGGLLTEIPHKFSTTTVRPKVKKIVRNKGNKDKTFHLDSFETDMLTTTEKPILYGGIMTEYPSKKGELSSSEFKFMLKSRNGQQIHQIKNDDEIGVFIGYILNHTLKIFDNIKNKSKDPGWEKHVDNLAETYEKEYTQYLQSIGNQQVKTEVGTHKVILNAIAVSNHIMKRIISSLAGKKKGVLRFGQMPDILYGELSKEIAYQNSLTCEKLGFCKTENGYTDFMMDLLGQFITIEESKLEEAVNAFVDAVEKTNFTSTLGKTGEKGIKKKLKYFDEKDTMTQKAILRIIKNIFSDRYKPVMIYSDSNNLRSNLNRTLAFRNIVDTLDGSVPNDGDFVQTWKRIKDDIKTWKDGWPMNLPGTMKRLLSNVKAVLDRIDDKALEDIRRNIRIITL